MICPNCGKENANGLGFCTGCGTKLEFFQEPAPPAPPAPPSMYNPYERPPVSVSLSTGPNIPPEYRPLGAWGYFGWKLLFSIPFVGFILLIVFACGASSNVNLKSFARSYFCDYIIIAAIFLTLTIIFAAVGGSFFDFLFYELLDF